MVIFWCFKPPSSRLTETGHKREPASQSDGCNAFESPRKRINDDAISMMTQWRCEQHVGSLLKQLHPCGFTLNPRTKVSDFFLCSKNVLVEFHFHFRGPELCLNSCLAEAMTWQLHWSQLRNRGSKWCQHICPTVKTWAIFTSMRMVILPVVGIYFLFKL